MRWTAEANTQTPGTRTPSVAVTIPVVAFSMPLSTPARPIVRTGRRSRRCVINRTRHRRVVHRRRRHIDRARLVIHRWWRVIHRRRCVIARRRAVVARRRCITPVTVAHAHHHTGNADAHRPVDVTTRLHRAAAQHQGQCDTCSTRKRRGQRQALAGMQWAERIL